MNILYVNNSLHLGGDNKCILNLCKELKEDNNIYILSGGGILSKEFKIMDIDSFVIENIESKNIIHIILNIRKIRSIIKKNNIDIIHSHHRMTTFLLKLACKNLKVKLFHTQHSSINDKKFLTFVSLFNVNIICVSNAIKNLLVKKYKISSKKMRVIYNTIDKDCLNKELDERLLKLKDEGKFIVAQVSRVVQAKGIYEFVDIAEQVIKKDKNIHFVFFGDGVDYFNLQKYISLKKLETYITLIGMKDNIVEQLKLIDLLLLCSYSEGLPLSPIEGFFKKIPVIGNNIEGINEEIIDSYNGFLIDNMDIKEFENKIIFLKNNAAIYTQFKENAYQTFLDKFDNANYINNHLNLYSDFI